MQRFRAATLPQLLVAATLIAAPGSAGAQPAASAAASAAGGNLWVDVNGGSCMRHEALVKYADAQACSSLQTALSAAHSGDIVDIAPGTYGRQVLNPATKKVTFRAGGSQRPRLGQVISAASNLTFRGLTMEERGVDLGGPCGFGNAVLLPCGSDQVFDNVIVDGLKTRGTNVHAIRGVGDRFVLRNSEIRNIVDNKGFEGGSNGMVIENNYWHDITLVSPGVHNECMYVDGGSNAIIRGNRFIKCPTMALFFTNYNGGPPYSNVLVENNVFGHTLNNEQRWHDGCSFYLAGGQNNQNTVLGWVVRYNTFEVPPCLDPTPPGGDNGAGKWYGNLGSDGRCIPEFVFRYNVGETCGSVGEIEVTHATNDSTHPNQAPFYVNAPAGNFQLRRGSIAINRGDPTTFPPRDGTLRSRLIGSAPDAGAYEFRGGSATTGIVALPGKSPHHLSRAVHAFEKQNPASLTLALGSVSRHSVRRLRSVQLIALGPRPAAAAETKWLKRALARKSALVRIVLAPTAPYLCGSAGSTP
ncbi:MAG TPA: right-handed parallel beta-helix repeat-containing protein, partial [Kribbellaceae bacterium]